MKAIVFVALLVLAVLGGMLGVNCFQKASGDERAVVVPAHTHEHPPISPGTLASGPPPEKPAESKDVGSAARASEEVKGDAAWAQQAAQETGLTLVSSLARNHITATHRAIIRLQEATTQELVELEKISQADDKAQRSFGLFGDLAKLEAAKQELDEGRCGIVRAKEMPTSAPRGCEFLLLDINEPDTRNCAALFLFPAEKYPQVAAANACVSAYEIDMARSYAAAFNARPVDERKAALAEYVRTSDAISALLRGRRNSALNSEEFDVAVKGIRGPRTLPLPGLILDREHWMLQSR